MSLSCPPSNIFAHSLMDDSSLSAFAEALAPQFKSSRPAPKKKSFKLRSKPRFTSTVYGAPSSSSTFGNSFHPPINADDMQHGCLSELPNISAGEHQSGQAENTEIIDSDPGYDTDATAVDPETAGTPTLYTIRPPRFLQAGVQSLNFLGTPVQSALQMISHGLGGYRNNARELSVQYSDVHARIRAELETRDASQVYSHVIGTGGPISAFGRPSQTAGTAWKRIIPSEFYNAFEEEKKRQRLGL